MNGKRAELIVTEGRISILVDRQSEIAKLSGYDAEYVVCKDYDPETKSWAWGSYTFSMANAYAILAEKLDSDFVMSRSEKMSGISYDRMSEIATKFKDALIDLADSCEDDYQLREVCRELDLSEKELKYFGIYLEDEEEDEEDDDYYLDEEDEEDE